MSFFIFCSQHIYKKLCFCTDPTHESRVFFLYKKKILTSEKKVLVLGDWNASSPLISCFSIFLEISLSNPMQKNKIEKRVSAHTSDSSPLSLNLSLNLVVSHPLGMKKSPFLDSFSQEAMSSWFRWSTCDRELCYTLLSSLPASDIKQLDSGFLSTSAKNGYWLSWLVVIPKTLLKRLY